jgi:GNAT superfamily N-acetyltransferase
MSLPILKTAVQATPESLIRFFHQTELQWTRHLSEETQLDFGTALHNTQLQCTYMANRMFDVALPPGCTAEQAMAEVTAHYAAVAAPCWQWVMNPSAKPEQTAPMIDLLTARAYTPEATDIMHLERLSVRALDEKASGLTIIPARASFRHTRILHEEAARKWDAPELADAAMMHLDDPHYDALLALKNGEPAAHIGVLAMGEVGLVEEVFVMAALRRTGIGRVMLNRAMEICARSLFKHVLLAVAPDNAGAIQLYQSFGFRKIGQFVAYQKPR